MLYRHGDVLISSIKKIPEDAKKRPGKMLVEGEITGHSHHFTNSANIQLYQDSEYIYIDVLSPKESLIHEEHKPISLEKGQYKVWIQREYTPQEIRRVLD